MASWRGNTEDSGLLLIERSHLFKSISDDDGKRLLEAGERVRFSPGETIMREGEEGSTFYLLKEGRVEVSTLREGERVVLSTLSPSAIFGEVSLLTKSKRTADVIAMDEVEAMEFPNEVLEDILRKNPKVRELLQSVVIARARKTIEKLRQG